MNSSYKFTVSWSESVKLIYTSLFTPFVVTKQLYRNIPVWGPMSVTNSLRRVFLLYRRIAVLRPKQCSTVAHFILEGCDSLSCDTEQTTTLRCHRNITDEENWPKAIQHSKKACLVLPWLILRLDMAHRYRAEMSRRCSSDIQKKRRIQFGPVNNLSWNDTCCWGVSSVFQSGLRVTVQNLWFGFLYNCSDGNQGEPGLRLSTTQMQPCNLLSYTVNLHVFWVLTGNWWW